MKKDDEIDGIDSRRRSDQSVRDEKQIWGKESKIL